MYNVMIGLLLRLWNFFKNSKRSKSSLRLRKSPEFMQLVSGRTRIRTVAIFITLFKYLQEGRKEGGEEGGRKEGEKVARKELSAAGRVNR